MTEPVSLLPPNASPYERALEAPLSRISAIPVPIRTITRPFDVPAQMLPFLGWHHSVDIWLPTFTAQTQRAVVAGSMGIHRRKGVLWAIEQYVRLVGGEIVEVERPPSKIFSGPSLTREEREAWLSALPQVRIWRTQEPGTRGRKLFSGGPLFSSFFEAAAYPHPSTARSRLRRRARWIVDGVETETLVTEFAGYFRLHFDGTAGLKVFCDQPPARRFFQPSSAHQRLVTIAPTERTAWRTSVGARLEPVSAEPERVVETGTWDNGVFCGHPVGKGFFRPSSAWRRVFHRYAVHDGRRVSRRPSCQIMGTGRYGLPPHTAILRISLPGTRPRWQAGEGINVPKTRFWLPHDGTRFDRVRRAVQSAMRLSDTILLRYGPRPRFIAGEPFFAGIDTYTVGRP